MEYLKKLFSNRPNLPKSPTFNSINPQKLKSKKTLLLIVITLIAASFIFYKLNTSSKSNPIADNTKVSIQPAKSNVSLDKEFNFPLKDDKGQDAGSIKFTIQNAELQDEIIIKGKKASAVKGKTFLIINLKVTNDGSKNIAIETRDYVRLSINGNEKELLAPDIHNDPVVVQAISTKYTRVGFPISESDKDLKLKIGEIKGNKQSIDLNFK